MTTILADIIGRWDTREVFIDGKIIALARFVRDLKDAECDPGDNCDIVQKSPLNRQGARATMVPATRIRKAGTTINV
jgi:hypothetical protein